MSTARSLRALRTVPLLWLAAACARDVSAPQSVPAPVADLARLDPVPELAYVGNSGAGFVAVVNVRSMTQVSQIALDGYATAPSVAVAPGGKYLYVVTSSPPSLQKVDLATNLVAGVVNLGPGAQPADIAVTPSGHRIFVTQYAGHSVAAIDAATLTVLATIPLDDANGIAMGPGGRQVFVANQGSGRLHVIDVERLEVVAAIETGPGGLNELASGVIPCMWNRAAPP